MLQTTHAGTQSVAARERRAVDVIGLSDLSGFLRRQQWLILSVTLAVATVSLGAFYAFLAPPKYAATSALLIDTSKLQVFGSGDLVDTANTASISNTTVETQIEILKSGMIGEAVVKALNLTSDPTFMSSNVSLFSLLWSRVKLGLAPSPKPATTGPTEEQRRRQALGILRSNLDVDRAGLSYVVNITYVSTEPELAVRIANTISSAYMDTRSSNQMTAVTRATDWLQSRLETLREQGYDATLPAEERSAVRMTYDELMRRYTQASEQGSLVTTQAQVVTAASPGKLGPGLLVLVVGSLVFGSIVGIAVGLARDLGDQKIRSERQLESVTGIACLGVLSVFKVTRRRQRKLKRPAKDQAGTSARLLSAPPPYCVAVEAPLSQFAETLRNIKVSADNHEPSPLVVIGITSSVAGEGKSIIAANLACLVAKAGVATLLIDGDLRNPSLSSELVPPMSGGLVQIVSGAAEVADVIWHDKDEKLHFLPAGAQPHFLHGSEILSSARIKDLVRDLRHKYSFVVVDLPPVIPVVDVRAGAHLVDGFLFVVEWGKIDEQVLEQALKHREIEARTLGVVLNKVNLSKLRRYDNLGHPLRSRAYREQFRDVP